MHSKDYRQMQRYNCNALRLLPERRIKSPSALHSAIRTFLAFALAFFLMPGLGGAETLPPHNAVFVGDPAVMTRARQAIGTICHFSTDTYGPQVDGFQQLKGVGQLTTNDQTIVVRQRDGSRVAFLATTGDKKCRFVAAEPLPQNLSGEQFLDCRVDDPDPNKIPPLSEGLGLKQPKHKGLAAYIELDVKHRTLIARAGDDPRIKCSGFESGD